MAAEVALKWKPLQLNTALQSPALCSGVVTHDIPYHSLEKWSHLLTKAELSHGSRSAASSCCRGACPPPLPPNQPSTFPPYAPPTPIHSTCFHLSLRIEAGLHQTRAPRATPESHPAPTAISLLSFAQPISLCVSVLCDPLKPGRHVIARLDTENSGQQCFERRRKRGNKENILTQAHSVQLENMTILPEDRLIILNRNVCQMNFLLA